MAVSSSAQDTPYLGDRLFPDDYYGQTDSAEHHLPAFSSNDDSPSFKDLLDTVNPLQHIPIVSAIYRKLTGDEPGAVARLAGDTLYGGPIGLVGGLINCAIDDGTGKDIGEHAVALFDGDDDAPDSATTKLARADTPAAAPTPLPASSAATASPAPASASGQAMPDLVFSAPASTPAATPASASAPRPEVTKQILPLSNQTRSLNPPTRPRNVVQPLIPGVSLSPTLSSSSSLSGKPSQSVIAAEEIATANARLDGEARQPPAPISPMLAAENGAGNTAASPTRTTTADQPPQSAQAESTPTAEIPTRAEKPHGLPVGTVIPISASGPQPHLMPLPARRHIDPSMPARTSVAINGRPANFSLATQAYNAPAKPSPAQLQRMLSGASGGSSESQSIAPPVGMGTPAERPDIAEMATERRQELAQRAASAPESTRVPRRLVDQPVATLAVPQSAVVTAQAAAPIQTATATASAAPPSTATQPTDVTREWFPAAMMQAFNKYEKMKKIGETVDPVQ